MSSNIQDVIARLLGQPSSIFGAGTNDHGLGDPNVASPPEDFIASPNPGKPLPPEQRMEGWRRVATDFTYGLGQGLSAGSQNPTGRALRTSAGVGQILQQPMALQKAKEAMALQKQQQDQQKAQILMSILGQRQQAAQQEKAFGLQQQQFDLNKSNVEADNELAKQTAEAAKLQTAETNRQKQEAEALKYNTPLNPNSPIESQGGQYYAYPNPQGGDPILRKVGDAKPEKELKMSEDERLFADFKKHPDLVQKFGSDMVGFAKWKAAEMSARNIKTGDLTPQQLTRVTSLASSFDGNQTVKNFNEAAAKYRTVQAILARPMGGPSDLAVVYEFMKGLDPTSVVRETEFDAAAKSGNIFSGIYAKFNGYLKPDGGFLPDQVKSAFEGILKQKLDVSAKQVKGMYEDFGRRADLITQVPGSGKEWLTDYTAILADEPKDGKSTAPAGVDQKLWNVMTPEEQSKFK